MIQVIFAVSVVVAYLPFEQSDDNDKLMRAFSVSMVRSSPPVLPLLLVSVHPAELSRIICVLWVANTHRVKYLVFLLPVSCIV